MRPSTETSLQAPIEKREREKITGDEVAGEGFSSFKWRPAFHRNEFAGTSGKEREREDHQRQGRRRGLLIVRVAAGKSRECGRGGN